MGDDGNVGERVYALLKSDVLHARLSVHSRIDIAELANRYDVSTTPVREAVMRLIGEELLEPHPRGGARPRFPSEFGFRALFGFHARLAMMALEWPGADFSSLNVATADVSERSARHFFVGLAAASGNREFERMVARVADRLSPFRSIEARLLGDLDAELTNLYAALEHPAMLKRLIRTYHRRREPVVARVVWLLGSGDVPNPADT